MQWKITFYNDALQEKVEELPAGILARYLLELAYKRLQEVLNEK